MLERAERNGNEQQVAFVHAVMKEGEQMGCSHSGSGVCTGTTGSSSDEAKYEELAHAVGAKSSGVVGAEGVAGKSTEQTAALVQVCSFLL